MSLSNGAKILAAVYEQVLSGSNEGPVISDCGHAYVRHDAMRISGEQGKIRITFSYRGQDVAYLDSPKEVALDNNEVFVINNVEGRQELTIYT